MQTLSRHTHVLGWMATVALAAAPVAFITSTRVAAAPAATDYTWDTFAADVSIQQGFTGEDDGTPRPSGPTVAMRMERWKTAIGQSTAITLQDIDRPVVRGRNGLQTLDNPFLVVRMEYDGDGSAPRYFNRRGDRVAPPGERDRALLAIPQALRANMPSTDMPSGRVLSGLPTAPRADWLSNVVVSPLLRTARRQALVAKYGAMRSRVNGLDQYVSTTGDTTCEVLINPDTVVPVETNMMRAGVLLSRAAFAHYMRPDGIAIRYGVHAERLLNAGNARRAVTDVTLTNVLITQRGPR